MTETSQKARILITGATGRLGQLLRAAWLTRPDESIEPVFTGRGAGARIILDGTGPLPALPACDALIALWGRTSNVPDLAAQNINLAHRSREVASAVGARLVIHLSSAAIYGPGTALGETATPAPVNRYGQSKLEMERVVAGFVGDPACHVCLRLANVVGADSLRDALLSDAPAQLTRYPDGHGPTRSYIAPGDLARALAGLIRIPHRKLPATLNVAAPAPVRMEDLLHAADRDIIWEPVPTSPAQHVALDTSRLRGLLPGLEMAKTAAAMIADWKSVMGAK